MHPQALVLYFSHNSAFTFEFHAFLLEIFNYFSGAPRSVVPIGELTLSNVQVVNVESLARGFLISVYLEKNSPGLLIRILEAFEKLGLEVLDANVSCSDCFQLQAVGEEVRVPYHKLTNTNITQQLKLQIRFFLLCRMKTQKS